MDSFFARYKNPLVLIAVLLAQTIGLALQVRRPDTGERDGHYIRAVRMWAVFIALPFERMVHATGSDIRGAWSNYINLRHVRQQNRDLRQEIAQLRLEQVALSEDALQGHRLQALLEFQRHYISTTVAAQVIGTSGSDQSHVIYIDKGSANGLKPDMAVITPDGVVGKLRDVFQHSAQVLELNDQSSGAGVILESTRTRAILRGTFAGGIQINNLTADSRIQPGERVLTSGGDQVYPSGLHVGTVESIKPDPEHQPYTAIAVRPAAHLNQLEEVLVITGTQRALPAQMQNDLNGAAATAEATRAATAAAERLPGIEDPAHPGAAAGSSPAAVTAPPVPKPLPVLHPDRFSPGATPPAAELKPGGDDAAPANESSPKKAP